VQADFRNAQKRLETEKQMQVQFANSQFMKSLLPVIDNFERALDVDPARTDTATVIKGLKIAYDQLQAILKSNHVEIISPAAGEAFDPNLHQAIMQQPNDQYAEPTVTQLFQKGYAMHGRPLRPAQVAVSKVG
jgi:molecular chaperone GrpE